VSTGRARPRFVESLFARGALFVAIVATTPACQTASTRDAVALERAKELAIPSRESVFARPPRRSSDLVDTLNGYAPFTGDVDGGPAGRQPTPGLSELALATFYANRAQAARVRGRPRQHLEDLRTALRHAETAGDPAVRSAIMKALALAEADLGNYRNALDVIARPLYGYTTRSSVILGQLYARLGDIDEARRRIAYAQKKLAEPQDLVTPRDPRLEPLTRAILFEAEGRWAEAEPYLRKTLELLATGNPSRYERFEIARLRLGLATNLLRQGRPLDAEVEARVALAENLANAGKYTVDTAEAVRTLALIMARQGRGADAEALARIAVDILETIGAPDDAPIVATVRHTHGKIVGAQGDWQRAAEIFERARQGLGDGFLFERLYHHDLDVALVLLKAGRLDAALASVTTAEARLHRTFSAAHPEAVQARALRGLIAAARGHRQDAADILRDAGPLVVEQSRRAADGTFDWRLMAILEAYLDFLVPTPDGASSGDIATAFQVADVLRARTVQRAVNAQAARAAVRDSVLSELVRREQDLGFQATATTDALNDMLAAVVPQQDRAIIATLRSRLASLVEARNVLAGEIARRFPAYADLMSPPPPTIDAVHQALRPGEALVAFYVGDARSYVWALRDGAIRFATIPAGRRRLAEIVQTLRRPMDSPPRLIRDIEPFDVALAHELYRLVLEPVDAGWKPASHVLVAVHGPLALIPFGVLPTSPPPTMAASDQPFAEYRAPTWLVRSHALSMLPSVQTLIALRRSVAPTGNRLPFVGFGDPYFTARQAMAGDKENREPFRGPAQQIAMRSVSGLDATGGVSAGLHMLPRLPETATELRSIARALGADPERDVFLGREANEETVKTIDLSSHRVVAFATHALVPGDIDGLDQPALALTAPEVAGVPGDGLLTMGEILALRLNAEWIVLSACNTAAASGAGAEALSGLGRAFFYAGARALLVSHWPVETTSAERITTGVFELQAADPRVSRAEALRRTVVALMDREGIVDPGSGRLLASFAHPLFWAPFVLVGTGTD
jgi:CHAT domain-containing protein